MEGFKKAADLPQVISSGNKFYGENKTIEHREMGKGSI